MALSDDGVTWRRAAEEPFLAQPQMGKTINFVSYLHQGGKDFVFIEAGSTSGTNVYLATRDHLF